MTHAAHVHRPGGSGSRRRKAAAAEATDYPPGFFTALVRQHNWPPMWQPVFQASAALRGAAALAAEMRQAPGSGGWGHGTLPLPGTPKVQAPTMMRSPAQRHE